MKARSYKEILGLLHRSWLFWTISVAVLVFSFMKPPALSRRVRPAAPAAPTYFVSSFGGMGTAPGQFNKPRSIAFDGKATYYVIDRTDRVQAFDLATGRFLRLWYLPDVRLGRPERILWTPDGSLLITDTHYGQVLRYDAEGKRLATFGSEGREPGQMHYPTAVRVLADGRIAVTEYGGHDRIQFWDVSGRALGLFGSAGNGPGEFMRPQGLCQGPDGLLYVADAANQRIQAFTPEGRFVRAFGEAGTAPGRFSYPYDLGFDRGRLAVLESCSHRISLWTPQGAWIHDVGGLGTRPGELSNPWGFCLLGDGTVLVADTDNHRVQRWRLS